MGAKKNAHKENSTFIMFELSLTQLFSSTIKSISIGIVRSVLVLEYMYTVLAWPYKIRLLTRRATNSACDVANALNIEFIIHWIWHLLANNFVFKAKLMFIIDIVMGFYCWPCIPAKRLIDLLQKSVDWLSNRYRLAHYIGIHFVIIHFKLPTCF